MSSEKPDFDCGQGDRGYNRYPQHWWGQRLAGTKEDVSGPARRTFPTKKLPTKIFSNKKGVQQKMCVENFFVGNTHITIFVFSGLWYPARGGGPARSLYATPPSPPPPPGFQR